MRWFFIWGRFFYRTPVILYPMVDADFVLLVSWIIRHISVVGHPVLVHVFIDLGRDWGNEHLLKC